jgi:hypothetical protein
MNYEKDKLSSASSLLILSFLKALLLFRKRFYRVKEALVHDSYVQFGFTFMRGEDGLRRPQCFP